MSDFSPFVCHQNLKYNQKHLTIYPHYKVTLLLWFWALSLALINNKAINFVSLNFAKNVNFYQHNDSCQFMQLISNFGLFLSNIWFKEDQLIEWLLNWLYLLAQFWFCWLLSLCKESKTWYSDKNQIAIGKREQEGPASIAF